MAGILLVAGSCSSGDSEPTTNAPDVLPPPTSSTTTMVTSILTDEAREWCRVTGTTAEDELTFNLVFEAGLNLRLDMDVVNATAAGKRFEYEEAGMTPDEAVRAVYEDLLEMPDFVAACQEAYETYGDG